ncbi:ABC-F family ATP-binding cassette domain-containing protein [Sulfitobacter mediterraneus]|uniref:ABC-F family ATP-binding cassette domain-containing protein n=1 Tax=Sulfitobacter mediterraneus TaxID=83219 RepID=UPI001931DA18|nr:ABC-F family ATP-binding cassette domain-containing protein [Sulfitobacter mediterraneus]MBM1633368.1 ABC-F family ATP-binding cassette domain-containing protein [Sulfitobacter mediterraneus]MBM1640498.1 ABC-F family ATP-binding cassette domain-containing protein [Sulfitobacter mediterraneus]MBM1645233.1 ABC-F family ATP-binding cassette domain-containing protein [Sulfitobacter mediterraneus]MBM1648618.1 ABC-F family ATP-binding cassette domain-containing protein [Sulfitobacter mediterraneus
MTLLNVNALGVTLGDPLFTDLNLTISKGDRIGLVAANGRGKSTLMSCLAGTLEQTTGDVTRARGLRIGHVQQYVPEAAQELTLYDLVLDALPAEQAEYESWRVDVALDELAVPYDLQHQPLNTLSGGWQRTALLAAAWINEPDMLMLDEPTNHLDLHRIGLLQGWIAALPRELPVLITSHDRAFLDATTNRTLFLRAERSRAFDLPFTPARAALEEADAADERRFANDLNKAQQLRKQAAKLKNIGINSGSDLLITKTKQLNERAAKMEAAAKPAHRERSAGEIKLGNSGTHAKALITFDEADVTTPDGRLLYRTGQKWISKGDRVVLLGANGTGKTQLIEMVQRALEGHEGGAVKSAPSVVPAYSDQHLSQLDDAATPMTTVAGQFDVGDQRARGLLAGAGVNIQMQDTKIGALSGGQKARLAMLVLRLRNPNFYLLDEPTNHLDIEGQEALEEELIAHGASCLLVSHDRSFLRNVGNRFWWINGKKLEEVDSPEAFLQGEMAGN